MIQRYTREKMGFVWSDQNRFEKMLKVEKTLAFVQSKKKMIPHQAYSAIEKRGKFSIQTISRIEKQTKHDVAAFIKNVAQNVGSQWGRYIHFGLTSSDVLDTALSLQLAEASKILQQEMVQLKKVLKKLCLKYRFSLCAGRTHGMHAEPTTFGFKLLSFFSEVCRVEKTFSQTIQENAVGKISGPVGHYSLSPLIIEEQVCQRLGLRPETVSTQVVPRDRHARVLFSLCLILGAIERLAVELRHLQRTEVQEVKEGFSRNQQGSSAMPHKQNPISSENLTGIARLLRSYLGAAMENTALWHERDISHSSVERVILPDAFILCDYALHRMTDILNHLEVNVQKMQKNLLSSKGDIFSSQILLSLVDKGVDRQTAYRWIQEISHGPQDDLYQGLSKNKNIRKYLKSFDLEEIFSGKKVASRIGKMVEDKIKVILSL